MWGRGGGTGPTIGRVDRRSLVLMLMLVDVTREHVAIGKPRAIRHQVAHHHRAHVTCVSWYECVVFRRANLVGSGSSSTSSENSRRSPLLGCGGREDMRRRLHGSDDGRKESLAKSSTKKSMVTMFGCGGTRLTTTT